MRRIESFAIVLACVLLVGCGEPRYKKLNIKRAADLEPIAAPQSTSTDAEEPKSEPPPHPPQATSTEAMEIVEVAGFRGPCDGTFVGVNEEDLVTVRTATQVRTYRLAGISIPAGARQDAHNQMRFWLDKKAISVEVDESVASIDAPVYIHLCPDGRMVNEELVRAGLAVPSETRFRRTDALKKASIEALTAGRGVWGKKSP